MHAPPRRITTAIAALAACACAAAAATTTSYAASPPPVSVQINPGVRYQQMEGFGASLTDSSAWLLNNELTATQRNTVMNALFNPTTGIGMSFLRQPMGASDFATSNYTYDDIPANQTDYGLANFSIAREQSTIVPLLQQARTLNPNLRLMGTPWSPPAWMKTTGQINGGHLKNSDAVYNTYADYFVKYVQAYQAQGLSIDYLSMQNEPWFEATYPSMGMDPPEAARLIKLVGPKFQQNNIGSKILGWDHNWDNAKLYVPPLLADTQAARYIDGIAFHGYAGDVSAQTEIHNQFPDKGIFFTELTSTLSNTNFAGDLMWDMKNLVVGGARNWSKTVVRWNLALDQTGGPHLPGGAANCRGIVTIDSNTGATTFNQEYYSLGHISKFVQPGAFRVFSDADASAAFVNPDGSTALIAYNDGNTSRTFNLQWQSRTLSYILPAFSVATFDWTDPRSVGVWLTTGDKTKLLARQTSTAFSAPTPSTWNVNSMGNWTNAANWSDGVPNGVDHEARFAGAITSPRTIYTETPVTLGTIRFNSASTYLLAGTSTLTLQVSSSGGSALIDVQAGAHKINLPLTFASNTTVSVANGAALKISDPVTINPGVAVTHVGSGTIAYESYVNILPGGSLNLAAGNEKTLRFAQFAPGGGGGATIALADNDLVVAGGDFAQIRSLVADGSITSLADDATTTLALFDNALLAEPRWPLDAIVGKYTYRGDANLDGQVTEADFAAIEMNLDTTPPAGLAWVRGDVNGDGRVTRRDLDVVASHLGLGVGNPLDAAATSVPEPPAAGIVVVAVAALTHFRGSRPSRT